MSYDEYLYRQNYTNIKSVADKFPSYREHKCTIVVNKTLHIDVSVVVASSLSSTITKIIENDLTIDTFQFTVEYSSDESLNKIKSVVESNESVKLNKEDAKIFASFCLAI